MLGASAGTLCRPNRTLAPSATMAGERRFFGLPTSVTAPGILNQLCYCWDESRGTEYQINAVNVLSLLFWRLSFHAGSTFQDIAAAKIDGGRCRWGHVLEAKIFFVGLKVTLWSLIQSDCLFKPRQLANINE